MHLSRPAFLVGVLLWTWSQASVWAESTGSQSTAGAELLSNPDFALATTDPKWPDDWKQKPWITWESDKGTRYLHFTATEPGKTLELSRDIPITPEIKAIQITIRYRAKNIKDGPKKEDEAQATFNFYDAVKIKFFPAPEAISLSAQAADWTVSTTTVRVPEHAVNLTLSVGLHQVDAGAIDFAGISVKGVSDAGIEATAEKQDRNNLPVIRDGVRTIIGYGKPSVWFIHPYVDVLGHDFDIGISNLVSEAKEQGAEIAVGVANSLDDVNQQDEANTIYVFSYKNISYALPEKARRLVFLNTWLTSTVTWPAARTGKKDVVLIGSNMLNNDGDGKATDKDRWAQIEKDDATFKRTVLASTGYYLPIPVWRMPLLQMILEDCSAHPPSTTAL